MNLADLGRLFVPPREAENIPNPDDPRQAMQLPEMDLSRPGNMPPGSHYPNPDAQSNPVAPRAVMQMPEMDLSHGDNLGVSPMPSKAEHLAALGGAAPGLPPDPKQLSDPMQDPSFRAFVAQKAAQIAELKAAQGQAAESRGSLGMKAGNALITLGMVGGRGMDPTDALKQRYAEAGQPVADVLERQKASGELTKNATADVGLSGEMLKNRVEGEANNPDSDYSRAMLHAAGLRPDLFPGVSASMMPTVQKGQQLGVEKQKADTESFKEHRPEMEVNSVTGQFYNRRDTNTPAGDNGGRPLHPQDAAKLDAILNGIESVDRLKTSRSEGVLPGIGEYDATVKAEAPAIAAADSGTGRASGQGDVIKRAPNLYNAAGGKVYDNDRQRYVQAAGDRIAALKQAGYNVAEQEAHLARLNTGSDTGGMVDVVSPEGQAGKVPADKLDAALKKGFKRAGR